MEEKKGDEVLITHYTVSSNNAHAYSMTHCLQDAQGGTEEAAVEEETGDAAVEEEKVEEKKGGVDEGEEGDEDIDQGADEGEEGESDEDSN